jgi:hypothetical protein
MEILAHIMIGLGAGFLLMFVLVLWSMQIDYRIVIATLFGAHSFRISLISLCSSLTSSEMEGWAYTA